MGIAFPRGTPVEIAEIAHGGIGAETRADPRGPCRKQWAPSRPEELLPGVLTAARHRELTAETANHGLFDLTLIGTGKGWRGRRVCIGEGPSHEPVPDWKRYGAPGLPRTVPGAHADDVVVVSDPHRRYKVRRKADEPCIGVITCRFRSFRPASLPANGPSQYHLAG